MTSGPGCIFFFNAIVKRTRNLMVGTMDTYQLWLRALDSRCTTQVAVWVDLNCYYMYKMSLLLFLLVLRLPQGHVKFSYTNLNCIFLLFLFPSFQSWTWNFKFFPLNGNLMAWQVLLFWVWFQWFKWSYNLFLSIVTNIVIRKLSS